MKAAIRGLKAIAMLIAFCASTLAHADILVNKNVMVKTPSVPLSETLALTSAGMLTVTVSDLAFPQAFQSLTFAISDSTSVLKSLDAAGSLFYTTTGPMTLFANVYATPSFSAGSGAYHINVTFAPAVPLPAAVWLLTSGLFGIGALRRKHATVTKSVVQ